jgi:multiple sugar transport system ATP-binding protein
VAKITFSKVPAGYRSGTADAPLLDLELPEGQLTVITGPPGAGKSNLLRIIAGLDQISAGQVRMGEKVINNLAPHERDVAMVFANDSLYPDMTMRENIAFGLKLRRFAKSEIRKRIEDAGNALEVGPFLDKKPNECDDLTRQRVAIARAAARQPQVFLYDNPLANLKRSGRAELRNAIVSLHERLHTTTVLATADHAEAMSMAQTIVLLDRSAVQAIGYPRGLYEQPESMAVAKALGDPPMNFVQGELTSERGALQFSEADGGTISINFSALPRFEPLRSFIGKPLVLGVRPEEIEVVSLPAAKETNSVGRFRAIAERVEPLGPQTDIHFNTGRHAGICRIKGLLDRSEAGRRMEFVVNLEKVCFFGQSGGKRIV